ncbi:germinal center-associated signaling and motility protein isoform X2 [Ovis canadensis]|uniref:germinal center-associated signaling and motility protein isoform X2 n=1 Tax=Ovis canadensis TaxID=37174 RepID=UPI00375367CE
MGNLLPREDRWQQNTQETPWNLRSQSPRLRISRCSDCRIAEVCFCLPWKKIHLFEESQDSRKQNEETSSAPIQTMVTTAPRRICATPSSITASSGKGRRESLLRNLMRTFPSRLRGPEHHWEEPRLSTHSFVCPPPLSTHPPQRTSMNFSCPTKSSLTP